MATRPFKIQITQETLEDLQRRLANTRWAGEMHGADWAYGTNLGYLKSLVEYWQNGFDWRRQEEVLNRFAHFWTEIDGLGLHFIHQRGQGEGRVVGAFTKERERRLP